MATITFDIPNATQANRVLDKFALNKGYTGFLADGVTTQTKVQFLKAKTIEWWKESVNNQESGIIVQTALDANKADVQNNITVS